MSAGAAIRRHGTPIIALAALLGIAGPSLAEAARPLLLPLSAATMLVALLRVEPLALLGVLRRPALALAILAWVTLCIPALVWLVLSRFLPPDHPWLRAAVLIASAPSVMSAAAFALLLGADAALLTVVAIPSNALAPLVIPAAAEVMDVTATLDGTAMARRLALVVGSAFAASVLIAWLAGRERLRRHAAPLDTLLVLLVAAAGVPSMAGVGRILFEEPLTFLAALAFAFLLNLVLQLVGLATFWRAPVRPALSAALVSGSRNNVLLLAAISGASEPRVELLVAAAQLVLFVMPAAVAPLYAAVRNWRGERRVE
jgi:BASS family bile acid:Na+ symporter